MLHSRAEKRAGAGPKWLHKLLKSQAWSPRFTRTGAPEWPLRVALTHSETSAA